MRRATVTFTHIVLDSQEYGSDDEHMVSRVFFDLDVDGNRYPNLHCDINQTTGSSYAEGAIEVGNPSGYNGPFNYIAFRDAVENFFRSQVGPGGNLFNLGPGAHHIRMRNMTLRGTPRMVQFEITI